MSDTTLSFAAEFDKADPAAWHATLRRVGEEFGYVEDLGPGHTACFLDAGTRLLVTFENAQTLRRSTPDGAPRGFAFAKHEGWSHLGLISEGESWFREPRIFGYIDRLIDDGFFEDFDEVLFYGAHAGGYAAAAYSVAAPGARVLALRPQATLDPRIAGFDTRYTAQRRTDFTSRYGYAPDMLDAAAQAWIVFDPMQRLDAIHAALFTRANVTPLRCMGLGARLDQTFDALGMHDDLLRAAMAGTLDTLGFARMIRARRNNAGYLRAMYHGAVRSGHDQLAANLCASVLRGGSDDFFADKLAELATRGVTPQANLPRSRAAE